VKGTHSSQTASKKQAFFPAVSVDEQPAGANLPMDWIATNEPTGVPVYLLNTYFLTV
jgi:hypothetical protein